MFKKELYIKRKIRGLFWRLFNFLENNGDSRSHVNGEKFFIGKLLTSFSNTDKEIVVFDIGANIGGYSEMILVKTDELNLKTAIHLFEPTKACYSIMLDKFKNNENVILNDFGVSNEERDTTIFYDKEKSGLASLYQRNLDCSGITMDKSEKILIKRIDNYIKEKAIEHIDFIKIDIEGHELKAFEGFGDYLNGSFIDYIQFEYGGANLDSHTSLMELYKFLGDRGFKIAKVMPNGLEIREYSPFMDNFNYANYVAVSNKVL